MSLRAGQFVDVTAEIEEDGWGYRLLVDQPSNHSAPEQRSIFNPPMTVHCIVGTNSWMIAWQFNNYGSVTRWFTGTNMIEESIRMVDKWTDPTKPPSYQVPERTTRVYESSDGNPGRPGRVADLMAFDVFSRSVWLAFCSGNALKTKGRTIFPPNDLWKETFVTNWVDHTTVFQDGLGLPRNISLVVTNQPVFQYEVHRTTNVLGWTFPQEFYGIQYKLSLESGCQLDLTFSGRIKSITAGKELVIPEEVLADVKTELRKLKSAK